MSISEADLKILLKALAFAAHKHKDQRRKDVDASPYINHPISLADILCNEAHVTDIETICGALLHDTVEDTETTADELEREFGKTVCDIVMDVTDDKISNLRDVLDNAPADWTLERRQEYFDWARKVIDQIQGTHPGLEAIFDNVYAQRPTG